MVKYDNKFYVKKRTEKDIWQNLWEFILVEIPLKMDIDEFIKSKSFTQKVNNTAAVINSTIFYKQQLTHQTIEGCFILINLQSPLALIGFELVKYNDLKKLAFPRFITSFFEKNPTF